MKSGVSEGYYQRDIIGERSFLKIFRNRYESEEVLYVLEYRVFKGNGSCCVIEEVKKYVLWLLGP
jgi:hypothetical protein